MGTKKINKRYKADIHKIAMTETENQIYEKLKSKNECIELLSDISGNALLNKNIADLCNKLERIAFNNMSLKVLKDIL